MLIRLTPRESSKLAFSAETVAGFISKVHSVRFVRSRRSRNLVSGNLTERAIKPMEFRPRKKWFEPRDGQNRSDRVRSAAHREIPEPCFDRKLLYRSCSRDRFLDRRGCGHKGVVSLAGVSFKTQSNMPLDSKSNGLLNPALLSQQFKAKPPS